MKRVFSSLATVGILGLVACSPAVTPSGVETTPMTSTGNLVVLDASGPKATGGGYVLQDGAKVNFGFNGQTTGSGGAKGQIEVNDRATGQKFHGDVQSVICVGGVTTLSGTLTSPAGGTFTANVSDNGEPGTSDTFSFTTSTGYSVSGPVSGGNIQTSGACAPSPSPSPSPDCHRCITSGTQTVLESSYPSHLTFSFSGDLGEAATGQFTFTVTDTFTGAVHTITNTSATVVACENQSGIVDVIRIEGTATRTATNGESATGIYYLQVFADSGTGTFDSEITIQYQDTAGGNFFLGTGGREGIEALVAEVDHECP